MSWMKRIVALVLLVVGVVWIGQGLNLIPGSPMTSFITDSFMTGQPEWAVAGAVLVALAGAIARTMVWRRPDRGKG